MADKEIRVKHEKIMDNKTITDVNKRLFKERGLDIHTHEVKELIDDHKRGERIMKIKGPKKYFFMGK